MPQKLLLNSLLKKLQKQQKVFFFYQGFLHKHWRFTGQQGKGRDHLLFHSTTSTRSRTLRHLFATLHVKWLSPIFNRNAFTRLLVNEIYHLSELTETLIENKIADKITAIGKSKKAKKKQKESRRNLHSTRKNDLKSMDLNFFEHKM